MAKPNRVLSVEYVPLSSLRSNPRNARVHTPRQVRQIGRSLEAFGFNVPVLIDANNNIVAGHGRLLAAKQRGWHEVPAIRLEHLSEAQAQAFAIADNRLTEVSTWDDRLLAEVLSGLAECELDFSIEATGFSMTEIDLRIESLSSVADRSPHPGDQLPSAVNQPPVSKAGDLWVLDKHRIFCGDSRNRRSYATLTQGALARMVFADPPYNVRIDGHATGRGAIRHREFAMASGEMSEDEFADFLVSVLQHLGRHCAQGSLHYVCIDWRHLSTLLQAGQQAYTELKNICVWVKDQAGLGSFYRSRHELVLVYKSGVGSSRNNIELGRHGRDRTNVWNYPGVNGFGRHGEEGNLLAVHPTVKPVALIADAILDCTKRGELVLDPFLGSGSTLMAAQRVGRVCYGIEIDPLYVDAAIRRWQRMTGEAARLMTSGERFDAVAGSVEVRHG
jgi:DNA modification methylase